jgi:competence protein ComEC
VAGLGGICLAPLRALQRAQGQLFAGVPVCLGTGIALWFALGFEPGPLFYAGVALVVLVALLAWRFGPELTQPLAVALVCLALGLLAAGGRAHQVSAPMLDFRFYGAVQGRIVDIDRAQSDALRLTLDRVVLEDVAPARTPERVRISVQDEGFSAGPGQVILLTAFLSAPDGPAEPGGFDFRRMAYFRQLGAVGYSRTPVLLWQAPEPGSQRIDRLRSWLAAEMMAAVPGQAGAFAAGAMTGDRSGISKDTVQALRDSNLAHLLAISGMNMAFLTGFVFMLVRYGLALLPVLALRIHAKKVAAVVALAVAWFYLLLSGANVATERAFLMVCVILGAVLLDRRALSLRSVAISAVLLLLAQPESLGEPGFQLSFAATVVLIAGFGALDRAILREKLPRWMMPVFLMVLTSLLAGLATAPYAAATFNRFTDYGLLANVLTAPAMSVLMAGGAMAALLAPLGLALPALWVMELASRWILFVAHWVAGLDGAVTAIAQPQAWVIPVITLAGIWAVSVPGRWRWLAILPMAFAFAGWGFVTRPQLLIASDGGLVGLLGAEGRSLSVAKGGGFIAETWLQGDGDLALQAEAAARQGFSGPGTARRFEVAGWRGIALRGKAAGEALAEACASADLVIVPAAIAPADPAPQGCVIIGRQMLDRSGALAVQFWPDHLELTPAREGGRLWMPARPKLSARRIDKPQRLVAAD